jgi:hypothetical protein
MATLEGATLSSVPPWAEVFPRLSAIYAASNRASSGNWFLQPNVWSGLLEAAADLRPIEQDLQILDAESWAVFRVKAARVTHLMDKWGYSRALFDCFYEIKGYRYLLEQGYEEIRFVHERRDTQNPDLRARSGTSVVVMEVKTVNESTNQKNYFEVPGEQRIALDSEIRVSGALKNKLRETISRARSQLLAVHDPSVTHRIIYIVIRFDFHVHAEDDLSTFLEGQSTPEIKVRHCLLN